MRLSFEKVRTYPLRDRKSKVRIDDSARVVKPGGSFQEFFSSLPRILAGEELRQVVEGVDLAFRRKKPIIWCLGAHVVKCGLNPVMIDLMNQGIVTAVALNGAGIIHDVELALEGKTSEDVPASLRESTFGMAEETGSFINQVTLKGHREGRGLGETLGAALLEAQAHYREQSLLARAALLKLPVTVHVAVGGDIVHMHPEADGAAIGATTFHDFQVFCKVISEVGDGGVIFNVGSSVILPVVIEKAIAVTRNLGYDVSRFMGVTLDFMRHYRANLNPVERARDLGGKGFYFLGHHEIMLPLLAMAIKEKIHGS